jgi:hypothetical protein
MPNPIVELDVNSTEDVPEDLYGYLLDQFVEKAREMGYDVIEQPITLGNWRITCEIETETETA